MRSAISGICAQPNTRSSIVRAPKCGGVPTDQPPQEVHAYDDDAVPVENSLRFVSAMRDATCSDIRTKRPRVTVSGSAAQIHHAIMNIDDFPILRLHDRAQRPRKIELQHACITRPDMIFAPLALIEYRAVFAGAHRRLDARPAPARCAPHAAVLFRDA